MAQKHTMSLVEAQRRIEAAEMSVRRLWVEALALGGAVHDVEGRCAEVHLLVDEMQEALLVANEHALSEEVRDLRLAARAEGLVEETEVEDFVVRRLTASEREHALVAAEIAAGDGRAQIAPLARA